MLSGRRGAAVALVLLAMQMGAWGGQQPGAEAVGTPAAALAPPDAAGKQRLTVVVQIAPGWHVYGNPAGSDDFIPTTLTVKAASPLRSLKLNYPEGKRVKDPGAGELFVYEKSAQLTAEWQADGAGVEAVDLTLRYQACNADACLPPKTLEMRVKLPGK